MLLDDGSAWYVVFRKTALYLAPAPHCRAYSPEYTPPETWNDIIFRFDALNGCGDLIFSGHCLVMVMMTMCVHRYSRYMPKWLRTPVVAYMVVMSVLASVAIIASHKHYTVDVIISWLIVPPWWIVYHNKLDSLSQSAPSASVLV